MSSQQQDFDEDSICGTSKTGLTHMGTIHSVRTSGQEIVQHGVGYGSKLRTSSIFQHRSPVCRDRPQTFLYPVSRHGWLGFRIRVLFVNVPLRSSNDLAGFCFFHIDPMAGRVAVVPLCKPSLAFFFGFTFEDIPEAVVGLTVTLVQSSHEPGKDFI